MLEKYCSSVEVEATPTIFLYGKDKYAPTQYEGDLSIEHLNEFICGFCDKQGFGAPVRSHGYSDLDYSRSYGDRDFDHGYRGYNSRRRHVPAPFYGRRRSPSPYRSHRFYDEPSHSYGRGYRSPRSYGSYGHSYGGYDSYEPYAYADYGYDGDYFW